MIGGPIVGYMCASLQQMAVERDAAQRAAAAAEERTRLARAVHDGVLQVLSLVQRRAGEAGGDLAELGRLAGEQERSLRSLIRQQDTVTAPAGSTVDLAGALERLGTAHAGRVDVATPGTPVPVPAHVAQELVAAVSACLDNVRAHVGDDRPGLGAARRRPRRGRRLGPRRRSRHPGRSPRGGGRVGPSRGRTSRSGAASPTSAAPPAWTPGPGGPSGS